MSVRLAKSLFSILVVLLLQPSFASASDLNLDLKLIGAVEYEELGKLYYVAGYYENADLSRKSMLIKIKAKRWSLRKWRAQWQNNIAINNQTAYAETSKSDLLAFTELPQAPLRLNDEIRVDMSLDKGTQIYLNNGLLISASSTLLFNQLLNTWTGKFSPSRGFREKILGKVTIDGQLRNSLVEPIDERRINIVSEWKAEENRLALLKIKKAQTEKEKLRQEAIKKENDRRAAILIAQKNKEAQANAQKKALAQAKQAQLRKEVLSKNKSDEKKSSNAVAQQQREKKKQANAALKARKEKEQQGYLSALYHWNIQQAVDEAVVYPPWAKQFSQQGLVELDVFIDSTGTATRIIDHSLNASDILVQEVSKRLSLIVSELAKPAGLDASDHQFKIRYQFKLKGEREVFLDKPVAPQ